MQHLIWDWNGTLLDDQGLVVDALNAVLADRGLPPTDLQTYQALYTRPVRVFYERLLGRTIDDAEWERIDAVFHAAYRAGLDAVGLADGARAALDAVHGAGRTQSLLSMWRHGELVPMVDRLGLAGRFELVDGLRGPSGGRKAGQLAEHLVALGLGADRTLVVGDALDDAVAARSVGAPCVLYDGGSHPRSELEQAGVPVASDLTEVLDIAGL